MAALAAEGLHVLYGNIRALRGAGLSVPAGQIAALIGANGAGKTTMLRAISGLLPLAAGRVLLDGRDLAAVAPHSRVAHGLIHVPEGRRIFGRLTVRENLDMGAFTRRGPRADRASDLDRTLTLFPRLAERLQQPGGTLSGGEQQMLAMGRAIMGAPRTLLLDEPSMGLAPQFVDQVFDAILAINREGITVLLVEQNALMALEVADTAFVMQSGEVVLSGTGQELMGSGAVQEAYLG